MMLQIQGDALQEPGGSTMDLIDDLLSDVAGKSSSI